MASNYDDVLGQLAAAGLQVDHLNIGRLTRCKVEGDRERRGWYHLHEMRLDNGDELIVGSYGVWQGTSNNATKVELRKAELSAEQRDAMRKRLAEDRKRAEQARHIALVPALLDRQPFGVQRPAFRIGPEPGHPPQHGQVGLALQGDLQVMAGDRLMVGRGRQEQQEPVHRSAAPRA